MPRSQPTHVRLRTAARFPVGIGLTFWRYLWRLTPIDRWDYAVPSTADRAPDLPRAAVDDDIQHVSDGAGPMLHRLYRARIADAGKSAEQLVAAIAADLDAVAPSEFATFQRLTGEPGRLEVGDELVVRMPGPWDGPVRVVDVQRRSFRLATLEGHLEAGQIEFRAREVDGLLEFSIESWAASGDRLSEILYGHPRVAKEVQLHMWTSVLERVVALSEGRRNGPLAIVTRRVEDEADTGGPDGRRARRALAALAERSLNFDPDVSPSVEDGWHLDDQRWSLPPEPSGEPVERGSWETARDLMLDYQVADPAMVRATYRRDRPMRGRDMLLQLRYFGLRLRVGVRVGDVYEETRTVDGREARVFGWDYATLEGHFEAGRLHYEVWKWLDGGEVEFRLHAYSRRAGGGSPVMRLGFRLVGRRNQLSFYRRAGQRMQRFTAAQLEFGAPSKRAHGTAPNQDEANAMTDPPAAHHPTSPPHATLRGSDA